jgi:hypothetical protein
VLISRGYAALHPWLPSCALPGLKKPGMKYLHKSPGGANDGSEGWSAAQPLGAFETSA